MDRVDHVLAPRMITTFNRIPTQFSEQLMEMRPLPRSPANRRCHAGYIVIEPLFAVCS
jgi:hypothetical protein